MVRIIHFLNKYLKYIHVELATEIIPMRSLYEPNSPYYRGTSINPSTGLPISGSVDASGNTYGAHHDDYYRRASSDDYHRNNEFYNTINNYNNPHSNHYSSSCSNHNRY